MGCGASAPAAAPPTAASPATEARSAAPASASPAPAPPSAPASGGGDIAAKIAALLKDNPDNICLNTFDPAYYNSLSDEDKPGFLRCLNSGIENPDSGMGVYAMQPGDYDKYKPFFSKALAKYHKVSETAKHVNDWSLEGVEGLPAGGVLDLAALGLPALSMRVRVGRNLKAFPLPGAMTKEDRCNMENFMLKAFEELIENPACKITSNLPLLVFSRPFLTGCLCLQTVASTAPSRPAIRTSWTRPSTRRSSTRTSPSRTCRRIIT